MAWSNKQKSTAARAAKGACIIDEYRLLILRQFPNAMFNRDGRAVGEPTTTSSKLNNSDFEHFMAMIEQMSKGRVNVKDRHGRFLFSEGYWQHKADDDLQRMRHMAMRLFGSISDRGLLSNDALTGWIYNRVTQQRTGRLEELDYDELHKLINGLRAYARRSGLKVA